MNTMIETCISATGRYHDIEWSGRVTAWRHTFNDDIELQIILDAPITVYGLERDGLMMRVAHKLAPTIYGDDDSKFARLSRPLI